MDKRRITAKTSHCFVPQVASYSHLLSKQCLPGPDYALGSICISLILFKNCHKNYCRLTRHYGQFVIEIYQIINAAALAERVFLMIIRLFCIWANGGIRFSPIFVPRLPGNALETVQKTC